MLIGYLIAGFFLPLFPMSMVFNILLRRLPGASARCLVLLLWPQLGLALLAALGTPAPTWLGVWALATAILYAIRALSLRDLNIWIGFVAVAAWSLVWVPATVTDQTGFLHLHAISFSVPLIVLTIIGVSLQDRFGAAYAGLSSGLALSVPRLSSLLVIAVLAAIATPLFPNFFTMLITITTAAPTAPLMAITVGLVWLLLTWAGARLLQDMVIGPPFPDPKPDLDRRTIRIFGSGLAVFLIVGLILSEGLL